MVEELLYNPFSQEFLADPYPTYSRLLREAPVHRQPPGILRGQIDWLVISKHEHVTTILKDRRFIREGHTLHPAQKNASPSPFQPLVDAMNSMMLFRDPPHHTRLRSLVNKAFTPIVVESLRPRIQNIAEQLLAKAIEMGEFDLVREYALPLPVLVIADMLGVGVNDQDLFKAWSTSISRVIDFAVNDAASFEQASRAYEELTTYLREVINHRRKQPKTDLLTALIQAEEAGERLNEQELLSTCVLILVAGHETTTNLITNGVWTLHRFPEAHTAWRTNPDITEAAVEEILRFEPPIQRIARYASEPLSIGGIQCNRGEGVALLIGAANRDPDVFSNPDQFDITRTPNRHLALAAGNHFCLGAPLARLEGQIALSLFMNTQPQLQVMDERPHWRNSSTFRGLESLQVRIS